MKKLAAICLIAVIAFVLSCQESAATKAEREQMANQIKTLQTQMDQLSAKFDQLATDFGMHMQQFHTKATTAPKTVKSTTPAKPPRTGR
jgi:outer membrane murein-binding lipoprotein Lpp